MSVTIDQQDAESVLVKFDQQSELGAAVELLFGEFEKYGNPVSILYLPAGVPPGDILHAPGYVGFRHETGSAS